MVPMRNGPAALALTGVGAAMLTRRLHPGAEAARSANPWASPRGTRRVARPQDRRYNRISGAPA